MERWYAVAEAIHWKHFGDVRQTFRSADQTRVASGNTVAIFDIGGNNYRIVAAIHYDKARVFVLRVMTHPEYDKKLERGFMKTTKKHARSNELPKTYLELLGLFMLRPIHDDAELDNASEMLDRLVGRDLNKDQEDYLNALSTLVEEYESEHYPMPRVAGVDALRFLLEENGMNASDLSRLLNCHRSLGPKILSGERKLTTDHIRILCDRFKVSADLFLR